MDVLGAQKQDHEKPRKQVDAGVSCVARKDSQFTGVCSRGSELTLWSLPRNVRSSKAWSTTFCSTRESRSVIAGTGDPLPGK